MERVPSRNTAGVLSSCAFIWPAAPLRRGLVVKVHHPYFTSTEFHTLPDGEALRQYNVAADRVRALLESRGYSPEFIATLFRVPREQAKELSLQDVAGLPIDVALDELLSARCYRGNEQALGKHAAILVEIARLTKEREKLGAELPQRPGYELERDPVHSQDYARLTEMYRRIDNFTKQAQALESAYNDFRACKRTERIQASLRKSGQRVTVESRSKLKELASLVHRTDNDGVDQLLAKRMPDHELGLKAAEDLKERAAQLQVLWQELKSTLPTGHVEFISKAGK